MRISDWSSDVCSSDLKENRAILINSIYFGAVVQCLSFLRMNDEIGDQRCPRQSYRAPDGVAVGQSVQSDRQAPDPIVQRQAGTVSPAGFPRSHDGGEFGGRLPPDRKSVV